MYDNARGAGARNESDHLGPAGVLLDEVRTRVEFFSLTGVAH
jgi:hypothetical protein